MCTPSYQPSYKPQYGPAPVECKLVDRCLYIELASSSAFLIIIIIVVVVVVVIIVIVKVGWLKSGITLEE